MWAGKVLLLLICSCLLGGCWDRKEINDVAFVLGTAVDKEGEEYRATLQIALPSQLSTAGTSGGGGGTSGDKSYYLESKTGKTMREVHDKEQENVSRELNYSHRRTLIIGADMAREGIARLTDVLARSPENRLSALIVVAEGRGSDIFRAQAPIEQYPAEMVRELAYTYMKEPRNLKLLMHTMLSEGVDPVVPVVGLVDSLPKGWKDNKKNIKIKGLAVFQGDRMTGTVSHGLARGLLLAMDQTNSTEFIIEPPEGEGELTLLLNETDVKIKPSVQGDEIKMILNLRVKGELSENESTYNMELPRSIKWLEHEAEDLIRQNVEESIRVVQRDYQSDALGFGRVLKTNLPKVWDRVRERWSTLYPDVEVEVRTNVHIENIGAITKPFGLMEDQTHD
ncbi:Ger(x)C family spore germination protein [Paenibacillus sp. P96]|uniref:Ger(X)C family spore germination protein n=1 Tax=Paenibacillus zeirhizosphaerae TaxID=2987519 RepID=A0ABT9FN53_9BACL|nr:Ger(x)C family spore germination protein [Paenibacillus sp. P96]MDP4096168.1 Ger(x)C family spore germination protein [Paenibacillus sp. P96]